MCSVGSAVTDFEDLVFRGVPSAGFDDADKDHAGDRSQGGRCHVKRHRSSTDSTRHSGKSHRKREDHYIIMFQVSSRSDGRSDP